MKNPMIIPLPSWMNPHAWRKFKQAERNMCRNFFRRGRKAFYARRSRYWAGHMMSWLEKVGI